MAKKRNLKWIKQTLDLKDDHHWQAKDGYKVFVAGRGAVRFDVPQDWVFEPDEKSFRFLDNDPPDDNCRLEVSFNRLPPGSWRDIPLVGLLKKIVKQDSRDVIETGDVVKVNRQTARIVWAEIKFIDSVENREAYSRICIGLGSGIQCLITFDYWADEAEQLTPVWDEVMNSLTLGLYIRDPRTGLAFPD
ncbi:MAG: hypothetical protein F6K19_23245 [Cyanothece sp. SIO1E1]|nr:hypothetical protein [Cyanothece sp. SIO1E1]